MSRFFKNAIVYSSANLVAQCCKVAQEFVLRRLLPPEAIGVWNLAVVTQSFVATFDIGVIEGAFRDLPILEGAGNREEATRARATSLRTKLVQAALLGLCILFYALAFRRDAPPLILAAFAAGALLHGGHAVTDSLILFLQSAQRYLSLSRALLASSFLSAILLPIGALAGGVPGLLAAGVCALLAQGALLLLSARREELRLNGPWDTGLFKKFVGFGLPLRIVDYPQQLFGIADVMIITRFLGLEALAIYATAKTILAQAVEVPARLGTVFITRLFNQTGADRSRADLAAELMRYLIVTYLLVIPLLVCSVMAVVTFAVSQVIPRYASSLPVLQTLLFAVYFMPQTTIIRNFWMLDRRLIAIGASNLASIAGLGASFAVAVALLGKTLTAIALAMVAGYAFFFLYLMASIGREIWGARRTLELCALVALSVGWTALVVRAASAGVGAPGLAGGARAMALALARCVVLLAPLGLFAAWRTRLFDYLPRRRRAN